jgi:hypothetical protein
MTQNTAARMVGGQRLRFEDVVAHRVDRAVHVQIQSVAEVVIMVDRHDVAVDEATVRVRSRSR